MGNAHARLAAGTIARTIFLGSSGGDSPEKLSGSKLFIVARDDANGSRLEGISKNYAKTSEPKRLLVLDGFANAQFLFAISQGLSILEAIIRFFSEP